MAKKRQQLATQKENRGRRCKKSGRKKGKKHNKHKKEVGEEEA
jgi:hypothetical protein